MNYLFFEKKVFLWNTLVYVLYVDEMVIDRSDGQFFKAMEWRWLFFSNDGMAMVFENSHHHHQWFLAGSTIGSDGFSMVFPILGTNVSRWLQTEIRDKLRVNKTSKTEMQAINFFSQMFYTFRKSHIFFRLLVIIGFVWYQLQPDKKAENLLPSPQINGF